MAHGDNAPSVSQRDDPPDPSRHPSPPSAITKYLCAAAYLDPDFASAVLAQVLEERHRFVAPSYGVDVPAVMRHCLAARRREQTLQAVLAALIVIALFRFIATGGRIGGPVFLFLVAWGAVVGETLYRRHAIVANRIARDDLDLDHLERGQTAHNERIAELAEAQREGNVTVYGGYSPFVGSGIAADGWSFVLDLRKRVPHGILAKDEPFVLDLIELHDYVAAGIGKLDLAGLTVEDRLFVNGQDIGDDARFLPDRLHARPVSRVDDDLVRSHVGEQTHSVRHYLSARVIDWHGELVVSVYLRFLAVSGDLFAEANYFVLPGLKLGYQTIDAINPTPSVRQVMHLLAESLRRTPKASLKAPSATVAWLLSPLQQQSSKRAAEREIRENRAFNYGAHASVRELAMSSGFRKYFQKVDKDMYLKVLERRILDLVVTFFDDRGIDTSELRERRNTIVNYGVMMSGGIVRAGSLAVGPNASAVQRVADRVQGATSGGSDG
ncbi:MAG: hypothetical protein QOF60_1065 [Actinomycetota bacterium]|jgi:hypothetical protein|nr:hypothetical protein [Actinomycetota bacterium]